MYKGSSTLVGWRPSLLGWRPSLVGWRPSLSGRSERIQKGNCLPCAPDFMFGATVAHLTNLTGASTVDIFKCRHLDYHWIPSDTVGHQGQAVKPLDHILNRAFCLQLLHCSFYLKKFGLLFCFLLLLSERRETITMPVCPVCSINKLLIQYPTPS